MKVGDLIINKHARPGAMITDGQRKSRPLVMYILDVVEGRYNTDGSFVGRAIKEGKRLVGYRARDLIDVDDRDFEVWKTKEERVMEKLMQ